MFQSTAAFTMPKANNTDIVSSSVNSDHTHAVADDAVTARINREKFQHLPFTRGSRGLKACTRSSSLFHNEA